MFPIKDSRSSGIIPFITYAIIAINLLVLILEYTTIDIDGFVNKWALIPDAINFNDITTLTPLVTSLFLHANVIHFLSNMWFLQIFGDNVEGDLGWFKYALFYLAGGVIATMAQLVFTSDGDTVILGASGAVAAVLGYYFIRFPHHTVKTLVTVFFIFFIDLPSTIVLGAWFIIQLLSGISTASGSEGIAWWAHIGGFIFGVLIAKLSSGKTERNNFIDSRDY
ncbi:rhomboid family intramembrane serine protease [candidate division WWE3 bacterium]|nr:rhomboid family intramembrane serine protease [candidate division WWE3 bacterium]